jgi:uncharacterized lipoprotein YmbA
MSKPDFIAHFSANFAGRPEVCPPNCRWDTVVSSGRARTHLRLAAAMGLAALAAGCTFLKPAQTETHYYLLTPTSSLAAAGHTNPPTQGCVVRLRPVELADYLQTQDMAERIGTNEITFALFHRWAEPLDAGIRRVLAENLRAAPAIHSVLTDQPAPAGYPVYTISVHVLACEGIRTNQAGSTAFVAVWEITGPGFSGTVLDQGVFQAPPVSWTPGDYGQLASDMSGALGDFSKVLLSSLARLADAGANPKPEIRSPKSEKAPD